MYCSTSIGPAGPTVPLAVPRRTWIPLSKKYEKIVIYGKRKDGRLKITHGALQLHNGRWSSKLGQGPLIVHVKANAVSGPSYGKPIAVYYREREQE